MKRYRWPAGRAGQPRGGRGAANPGRRIRGKNYGLYMVWGLVILVTAIVCFAAGTLAKRPREVRESAVLDTVYETETVTEHQLVINQKEVEPVSIRPREEFYLVSETGYLLVFAQDQSTICLHTHIPITEFPEREQEKLREGIWFESMMEIFQYLESYTS